MEARPVTATFSIHNSCRCFTRALETKRGGSAETILAEGVAHWLGVALKVTTDPIPSMRVAVAGTFGPLHDGHLALFETALEFGTDGVVVALTDDELAVRTRHEPRPIPSFTDRRQAVTEALSRLDRWERDVVVRALEQEDGIATDDPDLDALVVSPETAPELEWINQTRRERGMQPLRGLVVPYVLADDGERISSTRIVRGEIDAHGNLLE